MEDFLVSVLKKNQYYSLLKDSTGFCFAAFHVCPPTTNKANSAVTKPANTNGKGVMLIW